MIFSPWFLLQTALGVNDLLSLYRTVSAAGFPLAIILAMWANYKGWWYWNREVVDLKVHCKEIEEENKQLRVRITFLDEEKFEWKSALIYGMGTAQKLARAAQANSKNAEGRSS